MRETGDIQPAAELFERVSAAAAASAPGIAARASLGASGCNIRLFRYREALTDAQQADHLAQQANDITISGAASGNEASIYFEVGDYVDATIASNRAIGLLRTSANKGYLAQALTTAAEAESQLKHTDAAIKLLKEAVNLCHQQHLAATEGLAQDHLGGVLLETGDVLGAGHAFLEAEQTFRRLNDQNALIGVTEDLAEFYLATKHYTRALSLIDQVLTAKQNTFIPKYWSLQLKGRTLLAMGRAVEARRIFYDAVAAADQWRNDVLMADSTSTRTSVSLATVYGDFIETAATEAIARQSPFLTSRTFEVLVASRAWAIRNQLLLALKQNLQLPPHYYELLTDLQDTQGQLTLNASSSDTATRETHLAQLQGEISRIENSFGYHITSTTNQTSLPQRNTTARIQATIGDDEVLLTFFVGDKSIFLWAVEKNDIHLYRLPISPVHLTNLSQQLWTIIQSEASHRLYTFCEQGKELSAALFGQLPRSIINKRNWRIETDGPFSRLPFSALPMGNKRLIQEHSVRINPSVALSLDPGPPSIPSTFLGIADPIYNNADPRAKLIHIKAAHRTMGIARLAGTEQEIQKCARAAKVDVVHILSGPNATISKIQQSIENDPPGIIHFSTHIVAPEKIIPGQLTTQNPALASIVLSLTTTGMPEMLTREMIATLKIPGSLVILNGCGSQQGDILPTVGVIGLSRAWLIAGASAVLVTNWEIPDDTGEFVKTFYDHFVKAKGNPCQRAAQALHETQADLLKKKGENGGPSVWAAYSVIARN